MTSILQLSLVEQAPRDWGDLLASRPDHEYTVTELWSRLAAEHYPAAGADWLIARRGPRLVAGIPVVHRRRRGLVRLESSFDGTLGGVLVQGDLDSDQARDAVRLLGRALGARLRGRTGLAVATLAGDQRELVAEELAAVGWQRQDYTTAVVDCRGGAEQVERDLWTNNRRNERNRGL